MFKNRPLTTILWLYFVILMVLCTSCVQEGYYSFSTNDGISKYSFQCPDIYENPLVDKSANYAGRGRVSASLYREDKKYSEAGFGIYTNSQETTTNMSRLVDRQISYQRASMLEDFFVLERSEIVVDAIRGEQVLYLQTYEPDLAKGTLITEVVNHVYFIYENVVFNIIFVAHEDEWDHRKVEFDHLVKTFKILD